MLPLAELFVQTSGLSRFLPLAVKITVVLIKVRWDVW